MLQNLLSQRCSNQNPIHRSDNISPSLSPPLPYNLLPGLLLKAPSAAQSKFCLACHKHFGKSSSKAKVTKVFKLISFAHQSVLLASVLVDKHISRLNFCSSLLPTASVIKAPDDSGSGGVLLAMTAVGGLELAATQRWHASSSSSPASEGSSSSSSSSSPPSLSSFFA